MKDYKWLVAEISFIWRAYQPSYAKAYCFGLINGFRALGAITEDEKDDLIQKNANR